MCDSPVLVVETLPASKIRSYRSPSKFRPCGVCLGCRIDKAQLWQSRVSYECIGKRSAFVTWTYDQDHLLFAKDGFFPTLCVDQFRHHIKNMYNQIRDKFGVKFRHFSCGQYGDSFQRPHYHSIMIGTDFYDFDLFFRKVWKNGSVKSLPVLQGSIRYVVDYFTRDWKTGQLAVETFDDQNVERPFFSYSKGLGFGFFLAHRDEIKDTGFITCGSRKCSVPSYYLNLFRDFSYSSIVGRYSQVADTLRRNEADARRLGYSSVDDFLYSRRFAHENSLIARFRSRGQMVDSPVQFL